MPMTESELRQLIATAASVGLGRTDALAVLEDLQRVRSGLEQLRGQVTEYWLSCTMARCVVAWLSRRHD